MGTFLCPPTLIPRNSPTNLSMPRTLRTGTDKVGILTRMQVTTEELAQYTAGLLSLVESGATVTVTQSGRPSAEIQPYPTQPLPYRTDPMGEDPSAPVLRSSP